MKLNRNYHSTRQGIIKRNPVKTYYTTSYETSLKQFIDVEVRERRNYTLAEVRGWAKKYNLNSNSKVIWVSPKDWIAWRYGESPEKWDDYAYLKRKAKTHRRDMNTYNSNEGFIIPESDDGDDGFLFVVLRYEKPKVV